MPVGSIAGLPLHPLVVHGAVVLVPLAVGLTVGLSWRARWRSAYGLWLALLAWSAWGFAYLAVLSGGSFESNVRRIADQAGSPRPRFGDHPELGQSAAFLAFTFALACTALFVVDRWGDRFALPKWIPGAVYAGTAMLGVPTLFFIVQAGHTGASLVWSAH